MPHDMELVEQNRRSACAAVASRKAAIVLAILLQLRMASNYRPFGAWQSDLAFLHEKYYIHYRDAVICAAIDHIGKRDDIAPGTTIFLPVPGNVFPNLVRLSKIG
jgi:hypothetical protein